MNKAILAVAIPIFVVIALSQSIAAYAYHQPAPNEISNYSAGWMDGQISAHDQYYNHVSDHQDGYCDMTGNTHHTYVYCTAYNDGYNELWNRAVKISNDNSFNNKASNDASVNIHGNNNKVTINQGTEQSTGGGIPDFTNNHSHHNYDNTQSTNNDYSSSSSGSSSGN